MNTSEKESCNLKYINNVKTREIIYKMDLKTNTEYKAFDTIFEYNAEHNDTQKTYTYMYSPNNKKYKIVYDNAYININYPELIKYCATNNPELCFAINDINECGIELMMNIIYKEREYLQYKITFMFNKETNNYYIYSEKWSNTQDDSIVKIITYKSKYEIIKIEYPSGYYTQYEKLIGYDDELPLEILQPGSHLLK